MPKVFYREVNYGLVGNENLKIIIFGKRIPIIIQSIFSLTILFMGILVLSPVKMVYCNPFTEINVDTANSMITSGSYPNLIILDVRSGSSYDIGHLENAINIPSTELDSRIDELFQYNDTEIIVYCETGILGAQAAAILDSYDFTKVFNINGGFEAWQSAGYSIVPELSTIMLIATLIVSTVFVAIVTRRKQKH
jgi:rhodanese-related sulfurtransferase